MDEEAMSFSQYPRPADTPQVPSTRPPQSNADLLNGLKFHCFVLFSDDDDDDGLHELKRTDHFPNDHLKRRFPTSWWVVT